MKYPFKEDLPIKLTKLGTKARQAVLSDNTLIVLPCLECFEKYVHSADTSTGRGDFNFFCSSECEDKFAWKQ